jgi:hypothetical protein
MSTLTKSMTPHPKSELSGTTAGLRAVCSLATLSGNQGTLVNFRCISTSTTDYTFAMLVKRDKWS